MFFFKVISNSGALSGNGFCTLRRTFLSVSLILDFRRLNGLEYKYLKIMNEFYTSNNPDVDSFRDFNISSISVERAFVKGKILF